MGSSAPHSQNSHHYYSHYNEEQQRRRANILITCEAATDAQLEDARDLLLDRMALDLVLLVEAYWGLRTSISLARSAVPQ